MKKFIHRLMPAIFALLTVAFSVSAAEAASVALLPLINNSRMKDDSVAQLYYKNALQALKKHRGFVLIEDSKLLAAAGGVPEQDMTSAEGLKKIASRGDADIVIVMELDKLGKKTLPRTREKIQRLELEGRTFMYNKLSGKFYRHGFYSDKEINAVFSSRWNWPLQQWGLTVRTETDRALRSR